MKLADKRSELLKRLEDIEDMSILDSYEMNRDYIKTAIRDAIGFIKEQDAQIRTIRGQMNKARREARALQGEDEDATV